MDEKTFRLFENIVDRVINDGQSITSETRTFIESFFNSPQRKTWFVKESKRIVDFQVLHWKNEDLVNMNNDLKDEVASLKHEIEALKKKARKEEAKSLAPVVATPINITRSPPPKASKPSTPKPVEVIVAPQTPTLQKISRRNVESHKGEPFSIEGRYKVGDVVLRGTTYYTIFRVVDANYKCYTCDVGTFRIKIGPEDRPNFCNLPYVVRETGTKKIMAAYPRRVSLVTDPGILSNIPKVFHQTIETMVASS